MQGDNENIDANLINKLEIMMLQRAQREAFAEEYALLKNGKPEQKSSRLSNLAPEFDSEVELIRVGGRLRRASNIEIDAHSIVLDQKHPVTQLLIKRVNSNASNHSAGYGQVFSCIRRRYWILKGLSAVKSVLRNCPDCQRWRGKAKVPRMADIPEARLRIGLPAFYSTGMDCFGPYQVKLGRRTEKRWGLVFKCMTTRAIHIELLSSMTSHCFIMAF
ncbi:uncharacterized protein LOC117111809 [Anneissia japonica]|uniref:uncharacterized protein LOC117111809 n=1 Tax=Anneissia japonica TaxID=1529436 RepID=UPI0014255266|nr:uncharacterized protein LOC117111809 [Anneissia japonica]